MFGQPRCREWTPLATQQLRLRSLIQIVGYNIYEREEGGSSNSASGSVYYTLHSTTMSAPFYTSEKLLSTHPKWREIDSELIQKMSSPSVVVRVWRHVRHDAHSLHAPTDTIVQTWGVNFNGLLHIGANLALDFSPKSFKANTLVFQMIGGFFCSYDSLKVEPSTKLPYMEHPKDVAAMAKEASPSRRIPIDRNYRSSESKSISPGKGFKPDYFESRALSKSHSPPVGCFRQSYGSYKSSSSNQSQNSKQEYYRVMQEGRERKRSDSYNSSIYEHSPKSDNDVEIREYIPSDESLEALKSCGGSLSASSRELNKLDIEESEQAEHFNSPPITKCRYSSMRFLNSEVRPSYTAEKLQTLHVLQFMIKKRTEMVQAIKEDIYKKSAIENSEDLSPHGSLVDNEDFSRSEKLSMSCREFLFTNKHRSSSRSLGKLLSESNLSLQSSFKDLSKSGGDESGVSEKREDKSRSLPPDKESRSTNIRGRNPGNIYIANNLTQTDRRFTLPLNKLLEFKSTPSPSQRLRHSQLTRQAELSRFKRRLLQDERDAVLAKLRRLRQEKCRLFEENQDNSTELMENYHSLSRKAEQLRELKKSETALRELYQRCSSMLLSRRWMLVQDLWLIYPIVEDDSGVMKILNIPLPACKDNSDGLKQCSEADLAVALGRVAHATALAASLLGVPLRHPVRLMGSRTKVLDHVAQENEIPLFARNKDSMSFRYGLFLLNRNIAQLVWATHRLITPDPRDTLHNLRMLLTPPTVTTGLDASRLFGSGSSMETTGTCPGVGMLPLLPSPSIRNMIPKHHHHRPFNRFKDSVNGTSPKAAMLIRKHRHSRSVGSYADEQNLQSLDMESSVMGSEPSLVLLDSPAETHPNSQDTQQDKHNISFSDSDLTKVTGDMMASSENIKDVKIFTVGDDCDTPNESRKSPKRQFSKSKSLEQDSLIDIAKVQELRCDVDRLNEEIHNLCVDDLNPYTPNGKKITSLSLFENSTPIDNITTPCLDFSDVSDDNNKTDETSKNNLSGEHHEFLLNVRSFEAYENETDEDVAMISNIVPTTNNNQSKNDVDLVDGSNSKLCDSSSCAIDIEKLAFPPFCKQSCGQTCPLSKDECPKVLKTGYDQCENGQEIMQDVIVLPSAEAVMTSSSHFTDSPLFEPQNSTEESPMNGDELVSLAKRVLEFENEETSNSILAVLKRSSIENDFKTENEESENNSSLQCVLNTAAQS